jgi:RHS repeat-associated protein
MKPKYIAVVAALAAFTMQFAGAANLPEFMTPTQLRAMRAEQIARAAAAQADVAKSETATMYTGKISDADAGGYLFKYRNYNPEMSRWTTVDPSGFPDGANGSCYAPIPTFGLDSNGLVSWRFGLPSTYYTDNNQAEGTVNINGFENTLTVTNQWHANNYYNLGLTSASLNASSTASLENWMCTVQMVGIGISVNTSTGALYVSGGSGQSSTNNGGLGLANELGVTYSSDHQTATITYRAAAVYSGGGFGGSAGANWSGGTGLMLGGNWNNASSSPIQSDIVLTISSYALE